MNIYVCVKHVPDTGAHIAIRDKTAFDESVKFVVNPYDEYGIEQALQIVQEQGEGEVIVVTVGKEAAELTLRTALGLGATRGILVKTDRPFLDSGLTSLALKKAIELDGKPDLIFTGKQSVDTEGMQVPYRLAHAMNLPVATHVVDFRIAAGKAIVEREIEGGTREVIEMTMPCIVGATKGLNEPRYPKLTDMIRAKKKEIRRLDINDFQLNGSDSGAELVELSRVPERGRARMLDGGPNEMAAELVRLLREEAKVL
jgi:electron transfer flavoprotein beta subunit